MGFDKNYVYIHGSHTQTHKCHHIYNILLLPDNNNNHYRANVIYKLKKLSYIIYYLSKEGQIQLTYVSKFNIETLAKMSFYSFLTNFLPKSLMFETI